MHQYFRRADTFRQFHEGPLGPYINSYGEWLHRRGYRRYPGRAAIRAAAHFSSWLMDHEIAIEEVSQDVVRRYSKDLSTDGKASIRQIMTISRPEVFAVKPKPIMDTPQNRFLTEFALHLRVERGLASGTIKYLLRFGAVFLHEMFGGRRLNWQSLSLADIVRFFQGQVRRSSAIQMHQVLAAVRSSLRFAHFRGDLPTDLSVSVPRVPKWSKTELPKYFSPEEVKKAFEICDRRTAFGKRNYAILLLLARFGLRAGEVASLQLESIDWDSGVLAVRGKGSRWSEFPLLKDVGEALADYLRSGRPESKSRSIFLRAVAPVQALHGQAAIGSIVRSVLRKAGIYQRRRSAHAFRHTLATDMLRDGVSLQEIGRILRHQDPDTTTIYAKVDLNSLRGLAVAWPGGAQ
jgi:integrase/recombinase XerD